MNYRVSTITSSLLVPKANIKLDKKPLEGCLSVLNILYEGWTKAIEEKKKNGL